jgi:hypothetical protein
MNSTGAPTLETSLKNSGKSRADLWQFAGNVALEFAINVTNSNCDDFANDRNNLERQLRAIEGEMMLNRYNLRLN